MGNIKAQMRYMEHKTGPYVNVKDLVVVLKVKRQEYQDAIAKVDLSEDSIKEKLKVGLINLKEKNESTALIAKELLNNRQDVLKYKAAIFELNEIIDYFERTLDERKKGNI